MNYYTSIKTTLLLFCSISIAMERPAQNQQPQFSLIVVPTELGDIHINVTTNNNNQSLVIDEISPFDLSTLSIINSFPIKSSGLRTSSHLNSGDNIQYTAFNLHPEHEAAKGFILKVKAVKDPQGLEATLYQKKNAVLNLIKQQTLHLKSQSKLKDKENTVAFIYLALQNEPLEFVSMILTDLPLPNQQKNASKWKFWKK